MNFKLNHSKSNKPFLCIQITLKSVATNKINARNKKNCKKKFQKNLIYNRSNIGAPNIKNIGKFIDTILRKNDHNLKKCEIFHIFGFKEFFRDL